MDLALASAPLLLGMLSGRVCPVRRKNLPGYVPPGWAFAAMWTIIYACMGGLIYQLRRRGVSDPWVWGLLAVNMLFNLSWTYVFSCRGNRELALWWILACKATLAGLAVALLTGPYPKLAAWLVVYLVWLDAAMLLNYKAVDSS